MLLQRQKRNRTLTGSLLAFEQLLPQRLIRTISLREERRLLTSKQHQSVLSEPGREAEIDEKSEGSVEESHAVDQLGDASRCPGGRRFSRELGVEVVDQFGDREERVGDHERDRQHQQHHRRVVLFLLLISQTLSSFVGQIEDFNHPIIGYRDNYRGNKSIEEQSTESVIIKIVVAETKS